jgi:hypothetical protein
VKCGKERERKKDKQTSHFLSCRNNKSRSLSSDKRIETRLNRTIKPSLSSLKLLDKITPFVYKMYIHFLSINDAGLYSYIHEVDNIPKCH